MKSIVLSILCLLLVGALPAQSAGIDQRVSVDYQDTRLGDVLSDLSFNYGFHFSYSNKLVPTNKRVTVQASDEPLSEVLDNLFRGTRVHYTQIGDQIVLKRGKRRPSKKKRKRSKEAPSYGINQPPRRALDAEPPSEESFVAANGISIFEAVEPLRKYEIQPPKPVEMSNRDSAVYSVSIPLVEYETDNHGPSAQLSLIPHLGISTAGKGPHEHTVSLNIFGGKTSGVNGVEVGGFYNGVENDVKGVQISGLINWVGGDLGPSDVLNKKGSITPGVQIGGILNKASNVNGVQIAGLVNVAREDCQGVQLAGLVNQVEGNSSAVQVAGLYNYNEGNGGHQIAGLANVAEDVEGSQMSGIYNKAKRVGGVQIGLINVSDTVVGGSFGLLNFVKKGYNLFEYGGGEVLHLNVQYKFGSRQFYNIVQLGKKFNNRTWAYGLGFGTALRMDERKLLNIEVICLQVHEKERWTSELNLLNQLRATVDKKIGRHSSFYWGPTLNVMVSQRLDPENGTIGSELAPYTLFDNRDLGLNTGTHISMWVGMNLGFRF